MRKEELEKRSWKELFDIAMELLNENQWLKSEIEKTESVSPQNGEFCGVVKCEEIADLERRLALMQETAIKLSDENRQLKEKNDELETGLSDDLPFFDDEYERDELILQLQDQHQQDCIKINQLNVTIDTLVDKYSRLRKTVGMD